jgi:hypothetical protein
MGKTPARKSVITQTRVRSGRENPGASDPAEGIAKWWSKIPLKNVLPALEMAG